MLPPRFPRASTPGAGAVGAIRAGRTLARRAAEGAPVAFRGDGERPDGAVDHFQRPGPVPAIRQDLKRMASCTDPTNPAAHTALDSASVALLEFR